MRPARQTGIGGTPAVLVAALVSAIALASCGGDDASPERGSQPDGNPAFSYRQSGGIAGLDNLVAVSADDEVTVSLQREDPVPVTVDPELIAKARAELEAADLAGLEPREGREPIPDSFQFDLTFGDVRISGSDVALREVRELAPVIARLDALLAAAIEDRGTGLMPPTAAS